MRRYIYLLLIPLIFLCNCNTSSSPADVPKNVVQQPKDNYVVLLDLGDRIFYNTRQQVPKDIAILSSIYSIFKSKLTGKDPGKHYYGVTDKLKLLGAPNSFYTSVDLSAEQPGNRAALPDKIEETYNSLLPEIYKGVITNGTEYTGADVWKYFNDHLSGDLDKEGQNTLFIITDGYMDVKNLAEHPAQKNRFASCTQIIDALKDSANWEAKFTNDDYGLIPIAKKFSNLRVVVLQLNPRQGWANEYSLLTKIWDKWFAEMGISNYTLVKNDSVSIVKAMLGKLMNVTMDSTTGNAHWADVAGTDSTHIMAATPLKTTEALNKTAATREPEKANPAPAETKDAGTTKTAPATAAAATPGTALETKPVIVPKKKEASTPEVAPPDESDARILTGRKTINKAVKKTGAKNNDDILQDEGAANGFNTGIKKDSVKKKQ